MRTAVMVGFVVAVLAGGWFVLRKHLSPAHQLGFQPENRPANQPDAAAVGEERVPTLGFARYLPADTDGYFALLEAGNLWRSIRSSQVWKSVAETEELRKIEEEIKKETEPERAKLPPEFNETADLLADAFDSEVCVGIAGRSSEDGVNLVAALILSGLIMAPSAAPPGSAAEMQLDDWRSELIPEWMETIRRAVIPSGILAAKVGDPERFDRLIYRLVDKLREAARKVDAGDPSVDPPPAGATVAAATPAFDKIYEKTAIGTMAFHRFTLRPRDHMSAETLSAPPPREVPNHPGVMAQVRDAVVDKALVVAVGFVGPYFAIALGPDDSFLRRVVAIYEGTDPDSLAASERFAALATQLKPGTTGASFADLSRGRTAIRQQIVPLLQRLEDPNLLAMLGAPPPLAGSIQYFRESLQPQGADYVRIESVQYVDAGLKVEQRSHLAGHVAFTPAGAPDSLDRVPEDALGYTFAQDASWDYVWNQIRFLVNNQLTALAELEKQVESDPRMRNDPRYRDHIAERRGACEALLQSIDRDLVPHLRGEMVAILGAPVPLSFDAPDAEVRDLPIPSGAIVVATENPESVVRGIQEALPAFFNFLFGRQPDAPKPPRFEEREMEGARVHLLDLSTSIRSGFEPHLFVMGKSVVLSSSTTLSTRIRETAAGKSPDIRDSRTHAAMASVLVPGAYESMFVDGGRLADLALGVSRGIFDHVEKNEGASMTPEQRDRFSQVQRFTGILVRAMRAHHGTASSTAREQGIDVRRQWLHVTDLEAEGK